MTKLSKDAKRKERNWKRRQKQHKGDFCYSVEITDSKTASRFVIVDRKETKRLYTLIVDKAPEEGGITLTLMRDTEMVVEYNYKDAEGDAVSYTMGGIEYDKWHTLDVTVTFTDNEPGRYYVWVEKKRK